MLKKFEIFKILKEAHEVLISNPDLKGAKDLYNFFETFKSNLTSKANDIFKDAVIELLQEMDIEVMDSTFKEDKQEAYFTFLFKSKDIQYVLNINHTILHRGIYISEFLKNMNIQNLEEYSSYDTFNKFGKSKNLKDTLQKLKEYEKVNDKKLYLHFYSGWDGKYADILVDRSFFEKKKDDIIGSYNNEFVPKRIYDFLSNKLDELGLGTYHSSVKFPYDGVVYIFDNSKIKKSEW